MADFTIAPRYSGAWGGGPKPLGVSPGAHAARSARPGRGRPHLQPRNKAPARTGGARPGPFPSPPLGAPPAPTTHRTLQPWRGSGLRSPPSCSSRTDGCWPAGPPAALARPRPGASLKRPRRPSAPRAPAARRIPSIATAPLKIERGGAGGAGPPAATPPCPPAPRRPPARPAECQPPVRTPPAPAERASLTAAQAGAAASPAAPRTYPGPTRGAAEQALRRAQNGNSSGPFKGPCAPTFKSPLRSANF